MEQGVIGFSAGLATTGKIPFAVAIAPFVTSRPFEMFRNDLGYMRQNVKVVGRCAGLTYSDLGATHQSLDDIAIIRTIPGVTVINPGDPVDIVKAVHAAAAHVGPVYIMDEDYPFQIGKGVVMQEVQGCRSHPYPQGKGISPPADKHAYHQTPRPRTRFKGRRGDRKNRDG
jgi:transketolase